MTVVVSKLLLSQFMNCPVVGAHAQGPLPHFINPPVNTVLPVITGSPLAAGSTLTASTGTWTSTEDLTYTYQWNRNGTPIVGATSSKYVIQADDVGTTLTVTVTATNKGGPTSATSAATGVIGGLINKNLPIITGNMLVGSTLTTDNGVWVGAPPPTFVYSWQQDGVDIPGATTNTYMTVTADIGHLITSRVIATNAAGSVSAYSGAVGPVTSPVVNTAPPVISGATVTGQVLSTTNGTWTGVPAPTFAYQWYGNGVAISGATGSTYTLASTDIGTTITVTVTASNSVNSVSSTSNSVGPIVAAAVIGLSNSSVDKNAVIGTTVGTLSVANGVGPYTYSLTSNPGNSFAISGSNLNVAAALTSGSKSITVQATGGTPSPVSTSFTITIAELQLSAALVPVNAPVGTTIGTFLVLNGTGSYTYTLTDPSGKFVISGSSLKVNAPLVVGNYSITVQATGGVPVASANFTVLVKAGVTWNPDSTSNTTLSGLNLIATNTGTTATEQGARV